MFYFEEFTKSQQVVGQLEMRGERDNQSVGLLICKSTDKTIVEWSLQDIQKPLGVASYQLQLNQGCGRCFFC